MMIDAGGRLWVFGRTANPHWVRGLGPTGRIENGQTSYPVVDPDKAYDAVIEVRDTTDGHRSACRTRHSWWDSAPTEQPGCELMPTARHSSMYWTRLWCVE
ncbi:MAG: hypothetical protein ABI637_01460 [Gemmatimonadota bacterium]